MARLIAKTRALKSAPWQELAVEAWPLRVAASALLSVSVATALVFGVEFVARGSLQSTLTFFGDAHRPGWTTVLVFLLVMLGLDALLGRRYQSLLVMAPALLLLAWIGQQKIHYLGDPLYPTDFLYYRQIIELMPLLVRERPMTGLAIAAGSVMAAGLFIFAWRFWRARF
ncbi:hypothetical protein AB4144_40185, partial [Rhizobiaceae sp. 2RAB30]